MTKTGVIHEAFLKGFADGGECFAPGNGYLPTSSCHMAFEAGRQAARAYYPEEIKGAFQSRGYSIRLELKSGERRIIKIDYDRKHVVFD